MGKKKKGEKKWEQRAREVRRENCTIRGGGGRCCELVIMDIQRETHMIDTSPAGWPSISHSNVDFLSPQQKKKQLCTLFANALWYRLVFYRAECFLLDLETRQMGFMNMINQEAISKKPLLAAICMPDSCALKIAKWQWEKMTRIDVLFNSAESHYFRRTRIHK